MARIAGVDLPPQKRIWVGLTSIYGIGQPRALSLCVKADVEHTKKVKDLTEEERPAHAHERAHTQRTAEGRRRGKEEGCCTQVGLSRTGFSLLVFCSESLTKTAG